MGHIEMSVVMAKKRGEGRASGKSSRTITSKKKMGTPAKPVADRNKNADFTQYLIKGLPTLTATAS